jgi:hypothetical protein
VKAKSKIDSLRKVLIKLMLVVYIFALIKPILPIVNDAFAHTFFNTQHIATVHYEYEYFKWLAQKKH